MTPDRWNYIIVLSQLYTISICQKVLSVSKGSNNNADNVDVQPCKSEFEFKNWLSTFISLV